MIFIRCFGPIDFLALRCFGRATPEGIQVVSSSMPEANLRLNPTALLTSRPADPPTRVSRLSLELKRSDASHWRFFLTAARRALGDNQAILSSESYIEPGVAMLEAMSRATRFNRWMADTLLPFVSGDVLELGAGMGNLTTLLCTGHSRYVATDLDENLLQRLRARVNHCQTLTTAVCDLTKPPEFQLFRNRMDTVICLNVLEHLKDDRSALRNIYSCLKPAGRALILVPQGMRVFGSLDQVLEHQRRYSRSELQSKMASVGFNVEQVLEFNRMTYPGWFLNSRILRRRSLSPFQLRVFDTLVPLWRRIDRYLPWPPTSIIGVGLREE